MTTLIDYLAAFFPDQDEDIYLRAFKAKSAPDAPDNYPLVEVITRRRLATDTVLQQRMAAANKTRGWYFVVNAGGNSDADVTRFNAFFVESDSLPIDEQHKRLNAAPIQPSIRLETRKSVHAFWLIDGACDVDAWRDMQEILIAYFDGDKSIKNPSRVMRLPFFNHVHYDERTGGYEYRRINLHTFEPEKRFTLTDIQKAFPRVTVTQPTTDSLNEKGAETAKSKASDVITVGSRHKQLLSLAGSMRRRGMSAEEIYAALKVTNQLRCQPSLEETEVFELCQDIEKRYSPEGTATTGDNLKGQASGKSAVACEFHFTALNQLLAEPEEDVSFVLEKTLPVGGFSICSAKPKVGKSTVARNLALCVSRGETFLGRETLKGKVLYLCLEEKRAEVAKHFRRMNASDDDILVAFITPENALTALQTAIAEHSPVLTIIDPLSRIVRVRDFNDYGLMSRALEPLIDLARKTACHILALHHDGKSGREGGDALLGSTALFGAVGCHIQMRKREHGRTVLTTQRYGEDMPETVVHLDASTGIITAGGDIQTMQLEDCKAKILDSLGDERLTETDIKERVSGNQTLTAKAIRTLHEKNIIKRTGAGKRGDPYYYQKSDACSNDDESSILDSTDIGNRENLENRECDGTDGEPDWLADVAETDWMRDDTDEVRERAAIMEIDGLVPCEDAQRLARESFAEASC